MRRWWQKIMEEDWASFTMLPSEAHGVPVLRVTGDIILATAPQFRDALKQAVDEVERTEGARRVLVVEFHDKTFMDSVALATLIGETEELQKRGGEVKLVISPAERRVRRILEVTGLESMFRVYSDVRSAAEESEADPTP